MVDPACMANYAKVLVNSTRFPGHVGCLSRGVPTVTILGVVDEHPAAPIVVAIETVQATAEQCSGCGSRARIKDRDPVLFTDLPAFERCARLLQRKRRWRCPGPSYPTTS